MSTNAELIDIAMTRLGGRSSARLRPAIVNEINSVINRLERSDFFPWFLETTTTLSIVINDTFVSLPSNFALEAEDSRPYYVLNGKVYYLEKRFPAVLESETPNLLQYYAISGNELHFRKAADQAYTLNLRYYQRVTGNLQDNSTEASNVWLLNAQDWVFGEALSRVAAFHVKDSELAANHSADARKSKDDLYKYHISRQAENQDFYVGGASDGT